MPGPQAKNQKLWERLVAGQDPHRLIAEGYPRTTVTRLTERIERGEEFPPGAGASPNMGAKRRTPAHPVVKDPSATVVRFTQEQIVLPGSLFLLYDHMRRIYPRYRATKSQWILDVIQCWAEERAEELGLNPMMWTQMSALGEPVDYPEDEIEEEEGDTW